MPSTSAISGTASAKPLGALGEQSFELVQPGLGRVVAGEAGRALQQTDDRIEGAGGVIGRAVVAERRVRLVGELLAQRLDEPRLADPGLAGEQHHLALAVRGAPPAREQQMQLFLATDERDEVSAAQRLEAAFGQACAHDPPGATGSVAFEMVRAKVGKLEQAADQAARAWRDHDAARLGQGLQPGRQVRRLADDRLFLRRALADQLADHDPAGRDADPRAEPATAPSTVLRPSR